MMNLYASYIKERENFETLEHPDGFAIYQIQDKHIYLKDIYVIPAKRNKKSATEMADRVSEIGIAAGCDRMMGSVWPGDLQATRNIQVLLAYGFKLFKATEQLIVFMKEL